MKERMKREAARQLEASARVMSALGRDHLETIVEMAQTLIRTLRAGGCIYICGNGGSAADAQHMAGELVGRFLRERRALPAVALTTDASILTALGNDYGFETVFERQVEALVGEGDCLVGISTSGNSPNVVRAVAAARRQGACTLALTGPTGGRLAEAAHICLTTPGSPTPRVQEGHAVVIHILCDLVEEALAGDQGDPSASPGRSPEAASGQDLRE